jgi:hypothetical protein
MRAFGPRDAPAVSSDDENVPLIHRVNLIDGEMWGESFQRRGNEREIDLVKLAPLHQDAACVAVSCHQPIELVEE